MVKVLEQIPFFYVLTLLIAFGQYAILLAEGKQQRPLQFWPGIDSLASRAGHDAHSKLTYTTKRQDVIRVSGNTLSNSSTAQLSGANVSNFGAAILVFYILRHKDYIYQPFSSNQDTGYLHCVSRF
jgi:hypothetical protein